MFLKLAATDFNLDTTNTFGASHDMHIPYHQKSRYITIARNAILGGLGGGAFPALINNIISGPLQDSVIWFLGIVATVGVGAFSAYKEATDTTEVSFRDRGFLGVEKRVRQDLQLPHELDSLRPDDDRYQEALCYGRSETFELTGRKFRKQIAIGQTHLGAVYRKMRNIRLSEHNASQPLFHSTLLDDSPGPTIAFAEVTALINQRKVGFRIAELYKHETVAEPLGNDRYNFSYRLSMEKRQITPVE